MFGPRRPIARIIIGHRADGRRLLGVNPGGLCQDSGTAVNFDWEGGSRVEAGKLTATTPEAYLTQLFAQFAF